MNPINAKNVQLVELHVFFYGLLFVFFEIILLPQNQHPEHHPCRLYRHCLPDLR